jgi:hypothetical protein
LDVSLFLAATTYSGSIIALLSPVGARFIAMALKLLGFLGETWPEHGQSRSQDESPRVYLGLTADSVEGLV